MSIEIIGVSDGEVATRPMKEVIDLVENTEGLSFSWGETKEPYYWDTEDEDNWGFFTLDVEPSYANYLPNKIYLSPDPITKSEGFAFQVYGDLVYGVIINGSSNVDLAMDLVMEILQCEDISCECGDVQEYNEQIRHLRRGPTKGRPKYRVT